MFTAKEGHEYTCRPLPHPFVDQQKKKKKKSKCDDLSNNNKNDDLLQFSN